MTFNFGTHVEKQNISYGEEIKYPNADIFSYKINGWKYQGQPFNEKYYNYTYGITLDNTPNYVWVSGNLCNYSIRNGISLVGNEVDSKFNELNKKLKNNNLIKSNNLDYCIITNCK